MASLLPQLRLLLPDYPSAKLFAYLAGTTTKTDTYTTSALSVANANPIQASAAGLFGEIHLDPAVSYKFVLAPSTDTDPPASPIFTVDGVVTGDDSSLTVLSKATSFTFAVTDGDDQVALCDTTAGAIIGTLYTAVGNGGKKIRLVNTGSTGYAVTVTPFGGQTIDGAASLTIDALYAGVTLFSDGTNWVILNQAGALSKVLSKTANYTVVAGDGDHQVILVDATAGAVTIAPYTAVGHKGRHITVKKIDASANAVTIDPNGAQTVDGATTITLTSQYDWCEIVSDGTNWVRKSSGVALDESYATAAPSAGTVTFNLAVARVFKVALTANVTTTTLQNIPGASRRVIFEIKTTADGTLRTWAWLTSTVVWPSGVAPTLTSANNKRDWFAVWTDDGGTTWFGSVVGQNY